MSDSFIAITNGCVYAPDAVHAPGVVLVRNRTIEEVGSTSKVVIPSKARIVDASGYSVVPGFIDLHIHGVLGHDAMGHELAHVIQALPAFGVTTFLATTLTLPHDETVTRLAAMSDVLASPPDGATCAGIHLEGPFLSAERPGMATREWFKPLTWEAFRSVQAIAGGNIRMVSFAPEVGDGTACIPDLLSHNVIPSIGHSDASFEDVERAVGLGLNHGTHTFNAMRPMHHRKPGVAGAVLFFNEIVAELIADGLHIHPAVLTITLRAKGIERVVLVSDASPLAGLPDGRYEWEHKPVFVRNGSCRLADGTIAGAHALLDTGVRNLVKLLNMPLSEALVPATAVPADVLGLKKGRLSPGHDADIVLLDADFRPARTFVGGRDAFRRPDSK
jgi:N-acetylglucosamine-6-phosphate deacetylase